MNPIRCSSCRRTVAITDAPVALRNKIYCSEWCAEEPLVTPFEARTDMWKVMISHGMSPVYVSKQYDVPHSQVYKAVAR